MISLWTGASCATKEKYTGPLKPALVGGTDWWMYGLCGCSVPLSWHWSLPNQSFVPAQTPPLWSLPWCSSPNSAGFAWPRSRCRKSSRSLSALSLSDSRSLKTKPSHWAVRMRQVLGKKTGGAASGLATEGLAPDAGSSIYG